MAIIQIHPQDLSEADIEEIKKELIEKYLVLLQHSALDNPLASLYLQVQLLTQLDYIKACSGI